MSRVVAWLLALTLGLVAVLVTAPEAAVPAAQDAVLPVPAIDQHVSPPEQTGRFQDTGVYNCLPASVTMVLQGLQPQGSDRERYRAVRHAFRRESPNPGAPIGTDIALRLISSLSDNRLQARIEVTDATGWEDLVRQQLASGFPLIVIINDPSLLAGGWQFPYTAHAIVITGLRQGSVHYNDPWDGRAYEMAVADFAAAWGKPSLGSGRRATAWGAVVFQSNQIGQPTPNPTPTSVPTPPPATATPTATPSPPPDPSPVLYQADWSIGPDGWTGDAGWKIRDGLLVSDDSASGLLLPEIVPGSGMAVSCGCWSFPPAALAIAPFQPNRDDYAIEAEIMILSAEIYSSFGLVARDGVATVAVNGGNYAVPFIGAAEYPGEPVAPGAEWHMYRLEVRGTTITFSIDGVELLALSEPSLSMGSGGHVGLYNQLHAIAVRRFRVIAL